MPKPSRRIAWLVLTVWAGLGVGAGFTANDAAARLTGQGTAINTESKAADRVIQRAFARPLRDVFAVTFESPEPVTAPRPAAALEKLAANLERMPVARGVVRPGADPGLLDIPLVTRDARSAALLVALDPANTRLDTLVVPMRRALQSALTRLPDGERYRVLVTGRAPFVAIVFRP